MHYLRVWSWDHWRSRSTHWWSRWTCGSRRLGSCSSCGCGSRASSCVCARIRTRSRRTWRNTSASSPSSPRKRSAQKVSGVGVSPWWVGWWVGWWEKISLHHPLPEKDPHRSEWSWRESLVGWWVGWFMREDFTSPYSPRKKTAQTESGAGLSPWWLAGKWQFQFTILSQRKDAHRKWVGMAWVIEFQSLDLISLLISQLACLNFLILCVAQYCEYWEGLRGANAK